MDSMIVKENEQVGVWIWQAAQKSKMSQCSTFSSQNRSSICITYIYILSVLFEKKHSDSTR